MVSRLVTRVDFGKLRLGRELCLVLAYAVYHLTPRHLSNMIDEHLVNKVGAWHVVVQAHLGPCRIEGDAVIHNVLSPRDHGRLAAARATEQAHACQLPKSPELARCVPDLDDLLIDQRAALRSAPDPLRTGFLGGAIAGEHVVFDVTFADAPFEEGMHVLAQVLGCAALAGLGDPINRRHDLPSRQRGDGEVEVILETPSERRHCRFPVDDLASGQRRFVGAIFDDQDRQRRALLVGELLPLDLALGVVRIDPLDHLASGDGSGLACGLLVELGPNVLRWVPLIPGLVNI
jgi:hypothetical protein